MSVDIPIALEWVLGLLGVEWPAIDEDVLREVAAEVRRFAACLRDVRGSTDAMLHGLGDTYAGVSHDAMIARWIATSSTHIQPIVECCDTFADGLEIAADGVVAAKAVVIAELTATATEFAAAQAAAVATFGIGEAAEAAVIQGGRTVVDLTLRQIEDEVIGSLAHRTGIQITGLQRESSVS